MSRFARFIGIDWSGAKGERHRSIAIASADAAGGPPALFPRPRGWTRGEVLDLLESLEGEDVLVGMDISTAFPFADCGAYFPGHPESPPDAAALWAMVDALCAEDPHLGAASFVDHPSLAPYFRRHGGREGAMFGCDGALHGRGRLRVTEHHQALAGCKPYSNFNLVGAAQVGKASLTGMRVLNRLRGKLALWPVDPLPATGPVVVEIYSALAAIAAGRSAGRAKMRNFEDLNAALAALGSSPVDGDGKLDDHSADALCIAAWLRAVADDQRLWSPAAMTPHVARTEGWTFGVA